MADNAKLGDVVLNLEARDQSLSRGIDAIQGKLKGFQAKVKGFDNIFKLAFGVGVGGQIFSTIHTGIADVTSGFVEAQKAGMGFADSVEVGLQKLLGMETTVERLRKQKEQLAEAQERYNKAVRDIPNVLYRAAGMTPPTPFPNVPNAQEAAAKLAELQGIAAEEKAKADEKRALVDQARANLARVEELAKTPGRVSPMGLEYSRNYLKQMEAQAAPFIENEKKAAKALENFATRMDAFNKLAKLRAEEAARDKQFLENVEKDRKADEEAQKTVDERMAKQLDDKFRAVDQWGAAQDQFIEALNDLSNVAAGIREGMADAKLAEIEDADRIARSVNPDIGLQEEMDRIMGHVAGGLLSPEDAQKFIEDKQKALAGDQKPQFVAFEEMAKRIQQAASPDDKIQKQLDVLEKSKDFLEDLRDDMRKARESLEQGQAGVLS